MISINLNQNKLLYLTIMFPWIMIGQNCHLAEGNYDLIYNDQLSDDPKIELLIKDSIATETIGTNITNYRFVRLSDNTFKLISTNNKGESVSELEDALKSLGEPYFEIEGCFEDSYFFELRTNPHIIIRKGRLNKVE